MVPEIDTDSTIEQFCGAGRTLQWSDDSASDALGNPITEPRLSTEGMSVMALKRSLKSITKELIDKKENITQASKEFRAISNVLAKVEELKRGHKYADAIKEIQDYNCRVYKQEASKARADEIKKSMTTTLRRTTPEERLENHEKKAENKYVAKHAVTLRLGWSK